jgi:acyl carrier protein
MGHPASRSIEEAIREHILRVGNLDPESLGPDTELVLELGMSSLELLSVLAFCEQRFGLSIRDEELVSLTTLSRIVKKVEELRAAQ